MEWVQQLEEEVMIGSSSGGGFIAGGGTGMFVKVMTDDQLETLRKQIAAYATICEQLIEMHKSLTSHPELTGGGARLGALYCDPFVTSAGHKIITGRQRWTPTAVQLQILERIFDQGNGTPSKQKITDITKDLSQHGQISEANVYNWFQNRRARSKRKLQVSASNAGESELEAEVESPNENKKVRLEDFQSQNINTCARTEDMFIQNTEMSSGLQQQQQQLDSSHCNAFEEMMAMDGSGSKSSHSLMPPYYESMLSESPRIDHLIENPYLQADDEYKYHNSAN